MRNTFLTVALVSGLSLAGASVASAQGAAAEGKGFSVGTTDVGPVIGVGGLAGAGAGFGGRSIPEGAKQLVRFHPVPGQLQHLVEGERSAHPGRSGGHLRCLSASSRLVGQCGLPKPAFATGTQKL